MEPIGFCIVSSLAIGDIDIDGKAVSSSVPMFGDIDGAMLADGSGSDGSGSNVMLGLRSGDITGFGDSGRGKTSDGMIADGIG